MRLTIINEKLKKIKIIEKKLITNIIHLIQMIVKK